MNKTNLVDTSDPIYAMNLELMNVRDFASPTLDALYVNFDETIDLIEEVIKEKYDYPF